VGNVVDEWWNQGDQEYAAGLPISPFMDRGNPNVAVSSQVGFIDFIVQPLYDAVHQGFLFLQVPMEELERNKAYWKKAKELHEAGLPSPPSPAAMGMQRASGNHGSNLVVPGSRHQSQKSLGVHSPRTETPNQVGNGRNIGPGSVP
jgi:hypothetical protein